MKIPIPSIDDRTYRQILSEAVARIGVHNPEWTNHSDADPGITVLQLFAFMTESLIFRANQIPERNRLKFLNLLGAELRPARSAQSVVTFEAPRGPPRAHTLGPGVEVFAGALPFRVQHGLDVLPIEAHVFYKAKLDRGTDTAAIEDLYRQLQVGELAEGEEPDFYRTRLLEPPKPGEVGSGLDLSDETVDSQVWLALAARPGDDPDEVRRQIAKRRITIGMVLAESEAGKRLAPGAADAPDATGFEFELPSPEPGEVDPTTAKYQMLEKRLLGPSDRAPVFELELPGTEELDTWWDLPPTVDGTAGLPPLLEDDDLADRIVTWVRVRPATAQLDPRITWIGINAARAVQRTEVAAETLGRGNGEPDQTFELAHGPVISSSVQITVDDAVWHRVEDLYAVPGEADARSAEDARAFYVDPGSGEVRFGNGLSGARPGLGARIVARYAYGGGEAGNVGIGAISSGPALPAGMTVRNPVRAWGGADAESIEAAERRIPSWLRHRDRLVSEKDFREITGETPGVRIGRVEVLPLFSPLRSGGRIEGAVTVMVIPRTDRDHPNAPRPDGGFLEAVCAHLEPKRLVTTELHVAGPEYVPLWISVGVALVPGADRTVVASRVAGEITGFLSPLQGGFQRSGWPLGRPVDAGELLAVATRVEGVAKVTGLLMADVDGNPRTIIPIEGMQLPDLRRVVAQVGDPKPLEEVRGARPTAPPEIKRRPIPVVPEVC